MAKLKLNNVEFDDLPPDVVTAVHSEFIALNQRLDGVTKENRDMKEEYKMEGMKGKKKKSYMVGDKEYYDMAEMYEDYQNLYKKHQDMLAHSKTMEAKNDSLQLELSKRTDTAVIDKLVQEKFELANKAWEYLGDDYDLDGKTNVEIKRAIVASSGLPEDIYLKYDEMQLDASIATFDSLEQNRLDQYQGDINSVNSIRSLPPDEFNEDEEGGEEAWVKGVEKAFFSDVRS